MDLERHDIGLGDKPALIIVDIINGFTHPESPLLSAGADVVNVNRELLEVFRNKRLPVFFTTVVYRNARQAGVFRQRLPALNMLQSGSHWVEIDEKLGRLPTEDLIEKCWASAFFGTDLDERLNRQAVDSLVITGLTTSGCVRASVLDGMQHDYPVVVPREAVDDRNREAHAANLHDMNAKYADVLALDKVLVLLSKL